MNKNHPVLNSLEAQLRTLRDQYQRQPNDQSRYQLVRHEQRMAQWGSEPGLVN